MEIVHDQRPSSELSDSEVVAYLVQHIRAQEITRAKQVQELCQRMFPDMDANRLRQCLVRLAQALQ